KGHSYESITETRRLPRSSTVQSGERRVHERLCDQAAWCVDVGCLRPPRREAQRLWVRRLLVHVVPFARGQARGRKKPPPQGASRSRGESARGPGLRRRRGDRVVSIRLSGRASAHLSPEGMGGRSHGGSARVSHHLHLRRQGLSAERRRSCGGSWCPRSDRKG